MYGFVDSSGSRYLLMAADGGWTREVNDGNRRKSVTGTLVRGRYVSLFGRLHESRPVAFESLVIDIDIDDIASQSNTENH